MNNDSFVAILAALLLLNEFDVLILWSKENFKSFFRLKYALYHFIHFCKLNLNQISM